MSCRREDAVFLRESAIPWHKDEVTALASYPRSGNSVLRLLLEEITGVVTGSIYFDQQLYDAGWRGEGAFLAGQVAFVKTHDPMFPRFAQPTFKYTRIVHIVRNPFDAILSLYHLQASGQHNASATSVEAAAWDRHVHKQAVEWMAHYEYWRTLGQQLPYVVVRYDDLVTQPLSEMERLLRWSAADDPRVRGALMTRLDACRAVLAERALYTQGYGKRRNGDLAGIAFTAAQEAFVLRQTMAALCDPALGYNDFVRDRFNLTCAQLRAAL